MDILSIYMSVCAIEMNKISQGEALEGNRQTSKDNNKPSAAFQGGESERLVKLVHSLF